jgi:peptide/nickel transport system ATP-binding protein/oligopeptide transport system ATP-binding protein
VYHISHRVAVMYRGRIVELNTAAHVYAAPRHPYTKILLASRPVSVIDGVAPLPAAPVNGSGAALLSGGGGCPFAARCPAVMAICSQMEPPPTPVEGGFVRCHLHGAMAEHPTSVAPAHAGAE